MNRLIISMLLLFAFIGCDAGTSSSKNTSFIALPNFQLLPDSMNFEGVYVGEKSPNKFITIKNNGITPITFSAGLNLPDSYFIDKAASTCTVQSHTLQGGTSCLFAIYFVPEEIKKFSDNISITYNNNLIKLSLSGSGTLFNRNTMLDGVSFGIVPIGTNALGKARIRNIAGKDIKLSSPIINDADGFRILTTDCKDILPMNTSCAIDVEFQPLSHKLFKNYISITIEERPVAIHLTGTTTSNIILKPKISARQGHSSAEYKDRVYYYGGMASAKIKNENNISTNTTTFYDDLWLYGKDGYWQEVTTPDIIKPDARAFHASACADEKFFIFGGAKFKDNKFQPLNDIWWYSITQKRWVNPMVSLPMPKMFGHSANTIQNKIYIFGGFDNESVYGDIWGFDTDNLSFRKIIFADNTIVPEARYNHATEVINNKLYVIGGLDNKSKIIDDSSIYSFDPSTELWSILTKGSSGNQISNRYETTAASIGPDLYIFGGRDNRTLMGDFHKYSTTSRVWQELSLHTAVKPSNRYNSKLNSIGGNLYLFAGTDLEGDESDMWVYDTNKDIWQETEDTKNSKPTFRYGGASTVIDDKVYLFGGKSDSPPRVHNDMWEYNIEGSSWGNMISRTNPTPLPRYFHSMTNINHKAYIFGGQDQNSTALSEIWEYEPTTIKWKKLTPPTGISNQTARHSHSTSAIGNKLYIYGGINNTSNILSDLLVYDTEKHSIAIINPGASKPEGRYGHSSVTIGNNIYVFGGRTLNSKHTNELWKFNSVTNSWSNLSYLVPLTARYKHNAVAIGGIIYILGGEDNDINTTLNDIWAYNTSTGAWSNIVPEGSTPIIGSSSTTTIYKSGIYIYNMLTRTFSVVYR